MNIAFLFLSFSGVGNDRGMYGDLVCEFANRGHDVYVIAPSKNNDEHIESVGNIRIKWVKTLSLLNVGFVAKAVANLLLPYYFLKATHKFLPKHVDLIISPTPPITLTRVIDTIKRQYGAKFYLILRDIFPQNAVDLGIMSAHGLIYRYFRKEETKLYKCSDWIGCMSEGNIDYLQKHNSEIDCSKIEILPNWVDTNKELKHTSSSFMKEHNLEGKFIAIFGGNLGIAQNPVNIIDLAELYKDDPNVVFLIIGKGIYKNKMQQMVNSRKLSNVLMFDYIPRDEYESLAQCCNVGLVSLNGNFTIPNIPSRTLGYWQASLPVFAIVDKNTDLGPNIIDRHEGGVWCVEGNIDKYKEKFDILYCNKKLAAEMGNKGNEALRGVYNTVNVVNIISEHI